MEAAGTYFSDRVVSLRLVYWIRSGLWLDYFFCAWLRRPENSVLFLNYEYTRTASV